MLKLAGVAQHLDVSLDTARRYVKSGKIPSTFIGGAYRVSEEDLEAFVASRKSDAPKANAPSASGPESEQIAYRIDAYILTLNGLTEHLRGVLETGSEGQEHTGQLILGVMRLVRHEMLGWTPEKVDPERRALARRAIDEFADAVDAYVERSFGREAEIKAFSEQLDQLAVSLDHA